ncbi:MAG: alpha/beta fold hydrolase [Pyrinomonadaceae bacterium]|nr:alpha/beta fold hydrolase [Pyrinomonadaceae bacterium]
MDEHLASIHDGFRHGYARAGGVRLHYVERGEDNASDKRLVILLHGFPECWYSWRHQLLALSERYHVVAPDLRGYNLSDKPSRISDYKLDKIVQDVRALIGHFGKGEAGIVGHDWGAAVAWELARQSPGVVWKLAALQVPPLAAWQANFSFDQLLRSWYMLFFQLPRVPEWWMSVNDFAALERLFQRTTRGRNVFTETDIAIYKAALREPGALTAAVNYYRANLPALFRRRQASGNGENGDRVVRVPTLFIYGERDFAVAPDTVRGVDRFVKASYTEVRIARSNHWVQQESPAEVNRALLDFLDGI